MTHEARSSLRLYQDAAGCESVQTLNRQFRLVSIQGAKGPERLVLEEEYDIRHCLESESASSEATITAWAPEAGAEPAFIIRGRGATGIPAGNLYGLVTWGCCGSGELQTFYSLRNGRLLFSTSTRARTLEEPTTRRVMHLGFQDTFSAAQPAEVAADSTVVGILQWADDERPGGRIVIRAAEPEAFAIWGFYWNRGGRRVTDSLVLREPGQAGLAVEVELIAPGSSRRTRLLFPIDSAGPTLTGAVTGRGFTASGS